VYVRNNLKRSNLLLNVNDDFAILKNISPKEGQSRFVNGDLHFDFIFNVSQLNALRQNALTVLVTIKSEHQIVPTIIEKDSRSGISPAGREKLVNNILTHKSKLKSIIKNNQNIIFQRYADITSKIDKQLLYFIKNDKDIVTTQTGLIKRKITLQRKIDDQNSGIKTVPIKQELSHHNLSDFDKIDTIDKESQKTRIRLLNKGISPSVITNLTKRSISAHEKLNGTVRKITYPESNLDLVDITNLCYIHGTETKKIDFSFETVINQKFDDNINVTVPVVLDSSLSQGNLLIVEFSLLQTVTNFSSTKQVNVIEKVEKKLDIQSHINDFYRFSKPFEVISSSVNGQIFFEIKQLEKFKRVGGNKLRVFKKVISDDMSDVYKLVQFENVDSYFSEFETTKKLFITNFYNESSIFRFVPVNFYNENSCEFTDVVITPQRKIKTNRLVIIPSLSRGEVIVEFFNTDFLDIVAIRLLIRNVTTKEKDYSLEVNTIGIDNNYGYLNSTKLNNLIPYHIYELTTKLVFRDGTEALSSYSTLIENTPYTISIDIPEITPLVSDDDITFELNSVVPEDQVGLIKRLLLSVSSTYNEESLNSRNAPLDKFLAFNIIRYDLSNGDVTNLGIIGNNETFSDSRQSKVNATNKAKPGIRYKYLVYPLLRDPKNVIETNVILKDQDTKREYKFNPRKHNHPIAMTRGTIVSQRFIDSDTKNDMLYGKIGTSTSVEVTIPVRNNLQVTNCTAKFINRKKIILSWNVDSDIKNIDHFIILKEINDVRTIIGKSHCLQSNLNFFHDLTQNDVGNFRFLIIPISKNYLSLQPIYSNYLLINTII